MTGKSVKRVAVTVLQVMDASRRQQMVGKKMRNKDWASSNDM
jgi:hypothetical protein